MAEQHIESLHARCAEEREIWETYPVSMLGTHFDQAVVGMISPKNGSCFAVLDTEKNTVVGRTHLFNPNEYGVI